MKATELSQARGLGCHWVAKQDTTAKYLHLKLLKQLLSPLIALKKYTKKQKTANANKLSPEH